MSIRFDRSLRNAAVLACSLIGTSATLADQTAVIVVEGNVTIPGPTIVVHNRAPDLDLRARLNDATLGVRAQLREPQQCVRGLALVPDGREPIAASDAGGPSALLKGLSIDAGAVGVRRSGAGNVPAPAPAAPQQAIQATPSQPPLTPAQSPRGPWPPVQQGAQPVQPSTPPATASAPAPSRSSRASGAGIGLGVAIGSTLIDLLRSDCESTLEKRFALPAGTAPETLTVQVVVGARDDPNQMLALQMRLQPAAGEWVGVAH